MTRLTRRLAAVAGGAAVTLAALAAPAAAHTGAEAQAAEAGRTRITFGVAAECGDGALPTTGLRVQLPEGATDVQPSPEGGWTTEATATEVSWSSTDPAPGRATFVLEVVLAQPVGTTVYLPAIQLCPEGETIAWIQVPQTPGEDLAFPAPSIEVPANDTTPTTAAGAPATTTTTAGPTTTATMALEQTPITLEGSESNSAGLIVFIVIVVVVVGGAVILFVRYRGRGNTVR